MATPSIIPQLVLILILSGGLACRAARIPEHSCHELLQLSNCDTQKCSQECSKHPNGFGRCSSSTCLCTYYCKDPPL